MAKNATPEKVKQLLSSFLVSTKQSPEGIIDRAQSLPVNLSNKQTPGKEKSPSTGTNALRSYESYLERLDSFASLTWFGKPAELSPLICARYGWENVDMDMLQCVGCKACLSGQLPSKVDSDAYNKFKEKLKDNLLASHDRFCALAANPCPESFCVVRCNDPVSLTSGFTSRISSLNPIRHHLPTLDFSSIRKHGYDEGQGAAYCTRHLLPDSDVSPEVVTLSITGWTKSPSSNNVLMCSMCRRLIGLWNFSREDNGSLPRHSDEEDDDKSNEEDEATADSPPKAKRQKKMAMIKATFDPMEEHKHWCPWTAPTTNPAPSPTATGVSPSPQSDNTNTQDLGPCQPQPACIVALKAMAPGLLDSNTGLAQAMKVSPMVEGMRSFRQVMKAWSSPRSSSTQVAVTTSS